jgi:hypothetical protein
VLVRGLGGGADQFLRMVVSDSESDDVSERALGLLTEVADDSSF